jgi:hypothetical protein
MFLYGRDPLAWDDGGGRFGSALRGWAPGLGAPCAAALLVWERLACAPGMVSSAPLCHSTRCQGFPVMERCCPSTALPNQEFVPF